MFLSLDSGGNVLGQSASKRSNKLFIIKFLHFEGNLLINNFEALWSKILPPDLRTSVYFFYSPSIKHSPFRSPLLRTSFALSNESGLEIKLKVR